MKVVILKDRFNVHAVFVRNEVSEQEHKDLEVVAAHYGQEVVVKEATMVRTLGDMVDEIRALNDTGDDEEDKS